MRIYLHWWDPDSLEESGIVLYSKETGYLEYFDSGFFAQYDKRKEITEYNYHKEDVVILYLGEL
jgi:hypothetical protein